MTDASAVIMAIGAAILGAGDSTTQAPLAGSFPIVELRQYTLHDGQRDALISLFEREFVESQEAVGMKVIGTFTDLDRPNRFVWLRGFKDMDFRLASLSAFYGGPVWKAQREAANATMIDSDNVLLLRAPSDAAELHPGGLRPAIGEARSVGLFIATIAYLKIAPDKALALFEGQVKPRLEAAGIPPLAWFVPESAANNFPQLPVREGENLFVWFARYADQADHKSRQADIDKATAPLTALLARPPEVLRLKPTPRSELR